ncbi:Homoserine dehydrogenase [Candidatus Kinetoplastibacterium sorsogonicusi]|uniref:Homoserine dehydrogenase n=1 Tax=Candidatus Kinetoplastidibacterium kentomonadis TaxID=1576550 RepID=A0A3S7J9Y2_9PROT|nr:homoserine dehydrogenase [Candidatus Kinetoplastibacterium sorsogonicusi]AWD32469.1 Homoserine dehydrogenase [Candidatus Kinetoplastibacterium sorsogonicusi]
MNSMKVGLLGFGVVGSGTWEVLKNNAEEIARRAGKKIEIVSIADKDVNKVKSRLSAYDLNNISVLNDAYSLINDPNIDIVIELIGGDTVPLELILKSIENGKHIVTANKALLAKHGNKIFSTAHKKGVMVLFEAAVAGGIPIIKAIREGLTANKIEWIAGIINGTTNFILSEMKNTGMNFEIVLAKAKELGYAELDPTFDIEGIDAAHKITLLSSIAFGIPIQFDKTYIEGISKLSQIDINYAEQLGYRLKLIAITKKRDKGIEIRVHPTLIPENCLLANVEGAMNAVLVQSDAVGPTMYYGQGAGSFPTASAIIADLVDVTRSYKVDPHYRVPYLAFQPNSLSDYRILHIDDVITSYYLRITTIDKPGVLSDISKILTDFNISVKSMVQKSSNKEITDIVFLTHDAIEKDIKNAISKIEILSFVKNKITCIRVEKLV